MCALVGEVATSWLTSDNDIAIDMLPAGDPPEGVSFPNEVLCVRCDGIWAARRYPYINNYFNNNNNKSWPNFSARGFLPCQFPDLTYAMRRSSLRRVPAVVGALAYSLS